MTAFELIATKIQEILPADWEKVVFYAEVTESSYEMFYYVYVPDCETPLQCYDIPDLYEVDEEQIDEVFGDLYTPLLEEQLDFEKQGKDKWTSYTFVLESNGKFSVNYDYSEADSNVSDYFAEWKNKYLVR